MKVLVVEDNKDIAENIADYLEPLGYVLDFAADGVLGLHLAVTESFDVIVLDVMLPGMDGMTLCQKLRSDAHVTTPVIMLTAKDQLEDKLEGFKSGADDYLVKPFSVKELEVRLQALGKRRTNNASEETLQVADLKFNLLTLEASRAGLILDLNPIQRKLLGLLMKNSHRVVLRDELESHIWGDIPPDKDILRSHIYSLRNIIDKPFAEKILHTVHGAGYRLAGPDA